MRVATVAYYEADECFVNSALPREAAPRSLGAVL